VAPLSQSTYPYQFFPTPLFTCKSYLDWKVLTTRIRPIPMYGTRYGPYFPPFFQGITDLFQYSQRGFSKAGLCKLLPLTNSRTNGANLGILSASYSSGRSSLQLSSHSSRSGNLGTHLSSLHDMLPVARFQSLDQLRRGWK
jgi:hypothetical protein